MRALLLILVLLSAPHAERYRFLVPDNIPVQEIEPASHQAFLAAAQSKKTYGMKIELEVQRGDAPFRAVPLGTPICNGDHVAFKLTPSETSYATLLNQYPEDGAVKTKLLHPEPCTEYGCFPCAGNQRLTPDSPMRIPADPYAGFPVKNDAGDDKVLFFLSGRPFSRQARELAEEMMACPPSPEVLPTDDERTRAIDHLSLFRELGPAEDAYIVAKKEELVGIALNHAEQCDALP